MQIYGLYAKLKINGNASQELIILTMGKMLIFAWPLHFTSLLLGQYGKVFFL